MRRLLLLLTLCVVTATGAEPVRRFAIVGTNGDPPAADYTKDSGLTIAHVRSASVKTIKALSADGTAKDAYALSVVLTDDGSRLNKTFTTAWTGKRIAVIVDDVVISTPTIMEPSDGEFVLSVQGAKTRDDIERLVKSLHSDSADR